MTPDWPGDQLDPAVYRPDRGDVPSDYRGRVLRGDYSPALKQRVRVCIAALQAFEQIGNPAITYISAWQEGGEHQIWYEFASRLFYEMLGCSVEELAHVFRGNLIDRRVYKHDLMFATGITQEIIDRDDISHARDRLRKEVKEAGAIEAVYKVRVKSGFIWLKDRVNLEVHRQDGIYLSHGCLTPVTKEMEAEEGLKRAEEQLRAANSRIEAANLELSREIVERKRAETALLRANEQLARLATLDGLTQIANRRLFNERLVQSWEYLQREQKPLSLIMCDVDYFKLYNDAYGHQAGDECLRAVAHVLSVHAKRAVDLVARYGGEEFAVILTNTDSRQAVHVANLLREGVGQLEIEHRQSTVAPRVTLSQGVASVIPRLDITPADLIKAADQALYDAKQQGRDRIKLSATWRVPAADE